MEREDQSSIGGDASGFKADSTGDYSLTFDLTDIKGGSATNWTTIRYNDLGQSGGTLSNGIQLNVTGKKIKTAYRFYVNGTHPLP